MPKGRVKRSRNMSSLGTGCMSEAKKLGGTNLRRGRGIPARHREANNMKEKQKICAHMPKCPYNS
jgi:hypothetical protein